MDEWGRGPWFDPNAPEPSDPGETQALPPRTSDGPRPTDAPAPAGRTPGGSVPLSQRLGPDGWGDLDELAAAQGTDPDVSGGPAEGSGMRPRPTLSRPLYPPEPWNTYAGPNSGRFAPLSRPAFDDSQPLGQGFAGGAAGASGVGNPGGPGGPNQRGRGNGRRGRGRGRSVLALLLVLLMLVLLVGSIGFVLINSSFKATVAATATAQGTPTDTPPPTATPSPTPIPPPTAAKVTLSTATQQLSSQGSMTSCPSGCDITGNSYSHSQVSSNSFAATQQLQTELDGFIQVTNTGPGSWSTDPVNGYVFSGGGYACDARIFTIQGNGNPQLISCHIGLTTPASIAAGTMHGTISTTPHVTFTQPNSIDGNGYYYPDCTSAYSSLEAPYGQSWANGYMAGQSVPSGWNLALGQPRLSYTNQSCPTAHQAGPFNFTASVTANINDAAYNPGAAQSVAGSRRDNLLPSGYLWSSRSGCAPNVTGVDGSNKVSLNCSASGTAYYNWTSGLKANLAAAVAGQLKTAALDTCNKHTTGVAPNSCSISITGGDGTVLPVSPSVVTIQVNGP